MSHLSNLREHYVCSQTRNSSDFPLSAGTEVIFQVRCRIAFFPLGHCSLNDWISSAPIATILFKQVQMSLSSRHSIFRMLVNLRLVFHLSYNGAAVWYVVKLSPLCRRFFIIIVIFITAALHGLCLSPGCICPPVTSLFNSHFLTCMNTSRL